MKRISAILLIISLFTLNVLGVNAQTLSFSYADEKGGTGDALKPIFPMIEEFTQTPTTNDGSFIQAKIDSFNLTNKSVKVSLTISNKILEGDYDAPKLRESIEAEITFDKILVDNFDISFENEDVENRTASLLWKVGNLEVDNVKTFTYTLTLKENYSEDILDKAIAVFNKTDLKIGENFTTYDTATADCVIPMFKITLTENPSNNINSNIIIVSLIGISTFALILYLNKNNRFSKI